MHQPGAVRHRETAEYRAEHGSGRVRGIGPRSRSSSRRVPPSMSSITRNGMLAVDALVVDGDQAGSFSRATARASRWNR